MEIPALRTLHKNMITLGTDLQKFQIQIGSAYFHCLFSTRETPFTLSLTSIGEKPEFFLFNVEKGYWITPYFGDFYSRLAKVLNSNANTWKKLEPKEFLAGLNKALPTEATFKNTPTPKEIIKLRPDITDDREKPYFSHWKPWNTKKPSEANKHKTLLMLGKNALEYSIIMNASSAWTTEETEKLWNCA